MGRTRWTSLPLIAFGACAVAFGVACEEAAESPVRSGSINAGAGTAAGNYSPALRNTEVQTRFKTAADGIATYAALNGELPESLADLTKAGIVGEQLLRDPWDRPLMYEKTADGYRVWTTGPDGEDGTDDDIERRGSS